MPYTPTYRPYGLDDPEKRTIRNPRIKDWATFTKYGIENDGKEFSIRCLVKPGGGAITHRHGSYSETLTCVSGTMGVEKGWGKTAKVAYLQPGEHVFIAAGEWHKFFNPSKTEEFVFDGSVTPAHEGFEMALYIVYGLAEDGLSDDEGLPRSFLANCIFISMSDMEFPNWGMWLLGKVANVFAVWGDWSGEKARLIRRYYGTPIEKKNKKEL